jgi:hypothetical protein
MLQLKQGQVAAKQNPVVDFVNGRVGIGSCSRVLQNEWNVLSVTDSAALHHPSAVARRRDHAALRFPKRPCR